VSRTPSSVCCEEGRGSLLRQLWLTGAGVLPAGAVPEPTAVLGEGRSEFSRVLLVIHVRPVGGVHHRWRGGRHLDILGDLRRGRIATDSEEGQPGGVYGRAVE
jgi:hypothetical protein